LKILSNLATDIRFAFDMDKAGQAATERAIPIASKVGVNLSVVDMGSAKDPDELIKTRKDSDNDDSATNTSSTSSVKTLDKSGRPRSSSRQSFNSANLALSK